MSLTKPWLLLPPKVSHDASSIFLPFASFIWGEETVPEVEPFFWKGLRFANRLGTAGGLDKSGDDTIHWAQLGPGFLEVGTVTPQAQDPNPGKILDRHLPTKCLWNKMGFPSPGAHSVHESLKIIKPHLHQPLFVNIGKNRSTPNEFAYLDYALCAKELASVADAFVINISSPNTTGLRALQNKKFIGHLIHSVAEETDKPLIIKLSPDLTDEELQETLDACLETSISGINLTNTTLARHPDHSFPAEGGVSGDFLRTKSLDRFSFAKKHVGFVKDLLWISTGGLYDDKDYLERRDRGADLMQIYTGLVYEGPQLYLKILGRLQQLDAQRSKPS